jgi:hypothetical protein
MHTLDRRCRERRLRCPTAFVGPRDFQREIKRGALARTFTRSGERALLRLGELFAMNRPRPMPPNACADVSPC